MGSASSKAARKLPKRSEIPSWTPGPAQKPDVDAARMEGRHNTRPLASGKKDAAILEDAKDPHFLSNLSQLGPVSVNQPLQPVRSAAAAKSRQLLENRMRSDQEEISPHTFRNRVSGPTLTFVLDQRKSGVSIEEVKNLANKHGVDLEKLESVSRYVNSVSIQNGSVVRTVGQDGEESVSVMTSASRIHLSPSHLLGATSVAVAATVLLYTGSQKAIHNDAAKPDTVDISEQLKEGSATNKVNTDKLQTLFWGSNQSKLLSPEVSDSEHYRTPQVADWLDNVALRDLAFHKSHAACVDARGDVYQWGEGFSRQSTKPCRTLDGKDIIQIQLADSKVYALSRNGNIYVLSANSSEPMKSLAGTSPWWKSAVGLGTKNIVGFAEIRPRETLDWGEKFTSISTGNHHLLALTSLGRAFAHPITKDANAYGQLGFRKVEFPSSSKGTETVTVELVPKYIVDPYAKSAPSTRASKQTEREHNFLSTWFCPTIFEIPSLKDIKIDQLVAGGRSSFALTKTGRVLGWGANEYGQVGLGNNVTVDTITVPTEVALWRSLSPRSQTKCLKINAGGDLTSFTVEVQSDTSPTTIDVLMCGNGQWGGLGNNVFSNAQGTPVRAKNASGLLEYNDLKRALQPIHPQSIVISPSGHVLLTLDTSSAEGSGRDLLTWGKNYDSELGNGKKSSVPAPMTMHTPEGERFILRRMKAKDVVDLQGNRWKKGVLVEQQAVTGYCTSGVFWKIVQ
uniref:Uncharacterized protein n=1 Tax=Moniliophthora roreri TaxID=221103 RepID=A0A0W0FU55_MONRR